MPVYHSPTTREEMEQDISIRKGKNIQNMVNLDRSTHHRHNQLVQEFTSSLKV